MKHIISVLIVVLLLTGVLTAPTAAQQSDTPALITVDSDGVYMTQATLEDTPTTLPGQRTGDTVLSADRRYLAQLVIAPEYSALPNDEKATMAMLPQDIVVIDLHTGDVQTIADQSARGPDNDWLYRSYPVWSPSANQIVFVEAQRITGADLKVYDVDTQTTTTLPDMLPMGYSDAGMIGWPTAYWAEVGIYSLESNIAPDRMGFAQTLTLVDPTGQQPTQSVVVGRTMSGGGWNQDTALAAIGAVDTDGEPVLLVATATGEWFVPGMDGYGRRKRTLILRPSADSDIEIQFAQTTSLESDLWYGTPRYRAFIRRGDRAFRPLNTTSHSIYGMAASTQYIGIIAAPDGNSVLYRTDEGKYVQWFGPDDTREIDLGDRRIVAWGDWVIEAGGDIYTRPYLTVLDGPPTVRVIRDEPVDLFSLPHEKAKVIGALEPGDTIRVITGPLYFSYDYWYEIVTDDNQSGWVEMGPPTDNRWFAD